MTASGAAFLAALLVLLNKSHSLLTSSCSHKLPASYGSGSTGTGILLRLQTGQALPGQLLQVSVQHQQHRSPIVLFSTAQQLLLVRLLPVLPVIIRHTPSLCIIGINVL